MLVVEGLKKMSAKSPIDAFRDNLRDDVFGFFDYKRGGHLDRAAYFHPENWTDIVRASADGRGNYYLADPRREKEVLERIAALHNSFISNGHSVTSLFEIGAGTGDKIVPFLDNPKLHSITLIDYEVGLNEAAHDRIRKISPDIPITLLEQDFEAPENPPKISGRVLGMILGGTIANISSLPDINCMEAQEGRSGKFLRGALTRRFHNAARFYFNQGELLVTIDTGSKEQSLQAYQGPEHARFIIGALETIPDLLETDLTKEKIREIFTHEPVIIEPFGRTRAICHTVVCKDGASFTIEGRRFNIKGGFRNSVINSFKPTPSQLVASARSAGFRHIDSFDDDDRLLRVVHLKYEGEKIRSSNVRSSGKYPLVATAHP